jgi:hypothetical protein
MTGLGRGIGLLGAVMALGALIGLLWYSCSPPSSGHGQRADSVLADTVFRVDTLRQDSVIARLDSALAAEERKAKALRDSVARLNRWGRELIGMGQAVDSGDALQPGMTQGDSISRLRASRDIWRKAALHYSQQVVPALERQVQMETAAKLTALAKADTLEGQRDYARARVNVLTREFQAYRDATKEGIRLGPITLPGWVDEAALVVVSVGATCAATC